MNRMEVAQLASDASTKATYGGGVGAVIGGFTLNEWLAIGGFIIGVASFCVNFYFRRRMLQLAKEKSEKEPD